jgi:hypothetical protein
VCHRSLKIVEDFSRVTENRSVGGSIPPLGTILRRYAASPGAAMYALAYAAAKTIQRTFFLAKPGHTNLRRHCLAMPTPASAPHNRALMTN